MDFHHPDGRKDADSFGRLISQGWGKARLLAEMARCIVLCANCHRKEHLAQEEAA